MKTLNERLGIVKAKMTRLANEGRNDEKVVAEYRELLCESKGWKNVTKW